MHQSDCNGTQVLSNYTSQQNLNCNKARQKY